MTKNRNFQNCLVGSPFGLVLSGDFENFDFLAENYSENLQKSPNFSAGPNFSNALYKHDPSGCLVDLSNRKGDWYWIGTKNDRDKSDTTNLLPDSKKEELKKLKEDQKKQAKFEQFWARYENYSQSLILEIKHIKDLDNTIANVKKFQEFGTTTSELKHFRIGGRVLCQARRVLKNMLVEFYFMEDDTGMKLLTDFNEKLMETTENLSFSLQALKNAKKQGGRMMAEVVNQQKGDVIDFTKSLVNLCNKVVITNLETM